MQDAEISWAERVVEDYAAADFSSFRRRCVGIGTDPFVRPFRSFLRGFRPCVGIESGMVGAGIQVDHEGPYDLLPSLTLGHGDLRSAVMAASPVVEHAGRGHGVRVAVPHELHFRRAAAHIFHRRVEDVESYAVSRARPAERRVLGLHGGVDILVAGIVVGRIMEVHGLVHAHPVEEGGELRAEAGFAYRRRRIVFRMGEDAVGVDYGGAFLDGIAYFDVGCELPVGGSSGSGTHLPAFGNALDGDFRSHAPVGRRIYGDPRLRIASASGAHRVVRPESVLVIGHAPVEPVRVSSGRIDFEVGLPVGSEPRGENFAAFIAQRHEVAGLLGHHCGHDAVVKRICPVVFSDAYRTLGAGRED